MGGGERMQRGILSLASFPKNIVGTSFVVRRDKISVRFIFLITNIRLSEDRGRKESI